MRVSDSGRMVGLHGSWHFVAATALSARDHLGESCECNRGTRRGAHPVSSILNNLRRRCSSPSWAVPLTATTQMAFSVASQVGFEPATAPPGPRTTPPQLPEAHRTSQRDAADASRASVRSTRQSSGCIRLPGSTLRLKHNKLMHLKPQRAADGSPVAGGA